jgi:acetoin utilization protein AcuB
MNATTEKRGRILAALGQHDGEHATTQLVAADLMTKSPKCIDESTTLSEMVDLFFAHGFRHFIVTDPNDRLVGVISDRDVIGCLGPGGKSNCQTFADVPARRLMSTSLITIGPDSPISEAVDLMVDHGISCLPVLNQGEVVGILTNTDLHLLLQLVLQTTKLSLLEEPNLSGTISR